MTIAERIDEVLLREREKPKQNNQVAEFHALQSEMERIGFSIKPEYTLPPLDTIGRKAFEFTAAKAPKI